MCRKNISILLLLLLSLVAPVFGQAVSIQKAELTEWLIELESSRDSLMIALDSLTLSEKKTQSLSELTVSLNQKITDLQISLENYESLTKDLSSSSLKYQTQTAILDRELRKLKPELEALQTESEKQLNKIKRRNQIIITETSVILILIGLVWFTAAN